MRITIIQGGAYTYGYGSRKSAHATARLYAAKKGEILINDKPALDYFSNNVALATELLQPLAITQKDDAYRVTIHVSGGGHASQVDAIKLAISRALLKDAIDLRPILKKADLTSRDPREKERKKYGLRSARKREQFSKR